MQAPPTGRRVHSSRGNSMVEFSLCAPILFMLMLAAFDGGMYLYSFISLQNAARAVALRNSGGVDSASDQTMACVIATQHLAGLPSIPSPPSSCSQAPLVVTSVLCSGSDACG